MKAYKLRFVRDENDLADMGLEWLLDYYPEGDITGVYYVDESVEVSSSILEKPIKRVSLATIINSRVYVEEAEAYEVNGELYITHAEFIKHI